MLKFYMQGSTKQTKYCELLVHCCLKYTETKILNKTFIEINFVGKKLIQRLNKIERKKDCPTDVLSIRGEGSWLGSIIICPEMIDRARFNLPQIIIHGALHVLGHDHELEEDAIKMQQAEEAIYKQFKTVIQTRRRACN